MFRMLTVLLLLFSVYVVFSSAGEINDVEQISPKADLSTAETSSKLFNLGSLFGQNPGYGYGYGGNGGSGGYYPSNNRPNYYPNNGYYPQNGNYNPNYGSGSFYPSTGGSYYPTTGGGYYPTTGGSYYPTTGGNYYPNSGGYYPTTGGGYYPTTGSGTNILGGNGGYGGYGGNGGLRQYYGYWNPDYTGHRNRGYGYYTDTDRYGLPSRERGNSYGGGGGGGGGYASRGYN